MRSELRRALRRAARRLLGPLAPGWPDEGRRIVQTPHLKALLARADHGAAAAARVVNAGAGEGLYTPLLLAQPGVRSLVELDLSYGRHRRVRTDPRQAVLAGSLTDLPIATGWADLVLCSEVLEHVPDDGAALDELTRVLAPGGRLVITVPTPPAVDDPAHVREGYGPDELTRLLAARGLEVVEIRFAMHALFKLVLRRCRPGRWPRALIRLLARLDRGLRPGRPQDLLVLARPATRQPASENVGVVTRPITTDGAGDRSTHRTSPRKRPSTLAFFQVWAGRVAQRFGRNSWLICRLRPLYESALNTLSGEHGIAWSLNEQECRVDPHQRHRMGRIYDPGVAAYLRDRIRPGDLCVNVGANVGAWVVQLAFLSAPGGRVIAFEPNPRAREVLLRHLKMNGIEDSVVVVSSAVEDRAGPVTLWIADADGRRRLGSPNPAVASTSSSMVVESVTLDGFFKDRELLPQWLLIDVEGAEIGVLRGARDLLSRRQGEIGVIVELHPDLWDTTGWTAEDLRQVLNESGRSALPLSGQRDPFTEHGQVALELRR